MVLGRVRRGVVDLVAAQQDDEQEPDQSTATRTSPIVQYERLPVEVRPVVRLGLERAEKPRIGVSTAIATTTYCHHLFPACHSLIR